MNNRNICQFCNHWHDRCKKYEHPGNDCTLSLGISQYVLTDESSDLSFYVLWNSSLRTNHLIMRAVEYESEEKTNEFSLEYEHC